MRNPLDLNAHAGGYLIIPSKTLQEHGENLSKIKDFRKQLQYYNKNICSLSFHYVNGLYIFGYYDDMHGYGEIFFKAIISDTNFEIYLSERNKEIKRLHKLINEQENYENKLKLLIENRTGDRRYCEYDLKIKSNEWETFLRAGGGTVPKHLLGNNDEINLIPNGEGERMIFNNLLYNYIQGIISDPQKYHWLKVKEYNGFLSTPAIKTFAKQLEKAIDRELSIKNEIDRVESKFKLNMPLDYYDTIYLYSIDNYELWRCCVLKALLSGHEYDFSKRVFTENEMVNFIHVEQIFEYYKLLLDLKAGKNPLRNDIGFHSTPKDFDPNDNRDETIRKCRQHNDSIYRLYETNITNTNTEQGAEQNTENDFTLSTIEDWLFEFKQNMSQGDYEKLVSALKQYFNTGAFPVLPNQLRITGRVNKKLVGWALNRIFEANGKGVEKELLIFAKKNISLFEDAAFDESNYLKSNLYKYFTTKTQ